MILRAGHPSFPDLIVPGSPLKHAGSAAVPDTRAPAPRRAYRRVLSTLLGYDSERLTALRRRSII